MKNLIAKLSNSQNLDYLSKIEKKHLEFNDFTDKTLEKILEYFSEIENMGSWIEKFEINQDNKELNTYFWGELTTFEDIEKKKNKVREIRIKIQYKVEGVVMNFREELSTIRKYGFWYSMNDNEFIISFYDVNKNSSKNNDKFKNIFSEKENTKSSIYYTTINKIFDKYQFDNGIKTFQDIYDSFKLFKNLFLLNKYQYDYKFLRYSKNTWNFYFVFDIDYLSLLVLGRHDSIEEFKWIKNIENKEIKEDSYPQKIEERKIIILGKWSEIIVEKIFGKYYLSFENISEEIILFLRQFNKITKEQEKTKIKVDYIIWLENKEWKLNKDNYEEIVEYDIERIKNNEQINLVKYFTNYNEFELIFLKEIMKSRFNEEFLKISKNNDKTLEFYLPYGSWNFDHKMIKIFLIRFFEEFIPLNEYKDLNDYYKQIIKPIWNISFDDFINKFKKHWKKYTNELFLLWDKLWEEKVKVNTLIDDLNKGIDYVVDAIKEKTLSLEEVKKYMKNEELFNKVTNSFENIDLNDFSREEIVRYLPFLIKGKNISKNIITDYEIIGKIFVPNISYDIEFNEEIINTFINIWEIWISKYDFDHISTTLLYNISKFFDSSMFWFLQSRIIGISWKIEYDKSLVNLEYIYNVLKISEILSKQEYEYKIFISEYTNYISYDEFDLKNIKELSISQDILEILKNNEIIKISRKENNNKEVMMPYSVNIFNRELRRLFGLELNYEWEEDENIKKVRNGKLFNTKGKK
jgi:hypothetical protein